MMSRNRAMRCYKPWACLTAEIMMDMPERLFQVLSEAVDEEEVAVWLHEILMIGRAFERALKNGHLDDL